MPHLTLTLLGQPHIERDGQPVTLDTRKAVALLAYLAVTGQRHSRDALAALLYPETDQSRARATLRRTLSSLKSAIGEPSLLVERDVMALAPTADLWCDVAHFQRLLAQCLSHGHGPHEVCPRCLAPLTEAAALYGGDFLAGFTLRDSAAFDDWQRFESERLRRELLGALERLVGLLTTEGDLAAAIEQAQRLLAIDPLHEPAHRVLMLLLAWTGQTASALRQYRECVRSLGEELGVTPLPETTYLYEAIKEHRTPPPPAQLRHAEARSVRQHPAAIAPALPQSQPPAAATVDLLPLAGRTTELAALRQAHAQAETAGCFTALEGEPGIGKTRLAEEFMAAAQRESAVSVLRGRCFEGEAGLAYGVFVEVLRGGMANPDLAQRLASAPDAWLAEAARLLPELASNRALPPPPQLDHPGAQARFFEGLCQVIQTLAGRGGILFLDDLQWADSASLDALTYLVHRLADRPLLVLAVWRDEDSPAVQRLRGLVRTAQRAGQGYTLALGRLDRAAVAALAVSAASADLAERLHQQSEGLPLFVTEYLRAWAAGGTPPSSDAFQPHGVRSLLRARLAAVDEAGQQLLTAAAVIGRSFDFETLRAASGRSEEETLDCLERLVRHGLVRERSGDGWPRPAASFDFSHEQLRSLVYSETGLARRRLLHRRVAETLARQSRSSQAHGAVAALIAQHFQSAGRDADAAEFYRLAGEHAAALLANGEAVAHFRSALALGHPEAAALHEAIGDLHTLSGQYIEALAAYEQAAAHSLASPAAGARLEHKLGLVHQRQGEWELAESHFRAAQTSWSGGVADATAADLLADRSLNAYRRGQPRRAQELADEALRLAEAAQDQRALARAHNALGVLARRRGELEVASHHSQQSLSLAEALNDLPARVAALNNLALTQQDLGDTAGAIRRMETALSLCAAQGDRHREAALHNNLADFLHAAGQPAAAMDHLKQAVAIFAAIGAPGDTPVQPEIWKLVEW